ncbi:MAG: hypothetical protein KJ015_35665, partial [Myxococcales bacterium]|nr:hypothetical protein [Myxococcales bacterium]
LNASRVVARTNAHERVTTGEREAIGGVVVERERASLENASREIDVSMLFPSGHRTLKRCSRARKQTGVHGMPSVVFVSGSAVGPEAARRARVRWRSLQAAARSAALAVIELCVVRSTTAPTPPALHQRPRMATPSAPAPARPDLNCEAAPAREPCP